MNTPRCVSRLVVVISALAPLVASAHPGHDDGHELTWDMSHLAAHPLATLMCTVVIGIAAWTVWRMVSRPDNRQTTNAKSSRRLHD